MLTQTQRLLLYGSIFFFGMGILILFTSGQNGNDAVEDALSSLIPFSVGAISYICYRLLKHHDDTSDEQINELYDDILLDDDDDDDDDYDEDDD